MSKKGPMVSVRSGDLFGGLGFEYGRDIEVDIFCGRLSAVSIFLADAACVRGAMKDSGERREGGFSGIWWSAHPFQRARRSRLL
jgi:hypothetical protein